MDINEAGLKLLGFESKGEAIGTNIKETYVDPSERQETPTEMRERVCRRQACQAQEQGRRSLRNSDHSAGEIERDWRYPLL